MLPPDDLDLLPRNREDVGRDASEIEQRVRAQIADASLHVQLAVGANRHQAVMTDRPRRVRADGDANTAHLVAAPLPGAREALLPAEALGALVERLSHEGTRRVPASAVALGTEGCLAGGCVDLPQFHWIDAELFRAFRDRLVHDGDALHLTG